MSNDYNAWVWHTALEILGLLVVGLVGSLEFGAAWTGKWNKFYGSSPSSPGCAFLCWEMEVATRHGK